MSSSTTQRTPTAIILRATSQARPLHLEIPVEILEAPGDTIHQLAARKADQDLEEGRGWIADARDNDGELIMEKFEKNYQDLVKREAVRLGEQFQVANRWCSFVAAEENAEGRFDSRQLVVSKEEERQQDLIRKKLRGKPSRLGLSGGGSFTDSDSKQFDTMERITLNRLGSSKEPVGRSQSTIHAKSRMISAKSRALKALKRRRDSPEIYYETTESRSIHTDPGNSVIAYNYKEDSEAAEDSGFSSPFDSPSPDLPKAHAEHNLDNPTEKVHRIISLQNFAGFWNVDTEYDLSDIIGFNFNILSNLNGGGVIEELKQSREWITLFVVLRLEREMVEETEVWELVAEKAREWIVESIGSVDAARDLEEKVSDVLGRSS